MIKTITVVNYLGDTLTIDMFRPELSGFAIEEVRGFGPVKADINTTQLSTADGSLFNSARIANRNIVFKLILMPGELNYSTSVEDVRLRSYKFFPNKRPIRLIFETDNRTCYIDGYVEENLPTAFYQGKSSKFPAQQISIICNSPYFISSEDESIFFYGVNAKFEFPFMNDSLDTKLLEFGEIVIYSERNLYYDGDAMTGITIKIHAIGDVRGFTIYNVDTKERIKLDDERFNLITGSYISAGDEITIVTVQGKKSVTLLREGVRTNILNVLDKTPNWFQIDKGNNVFAYTVESGIENVQLSIENQVLFEGL